MVLRHASSAIGRETRARKEGEAPCCLRRTGSSSPQLKEALGRHRQTKSHVALAWTARSELQLPPPSFATMSTRSKLCGRGMKRARRRGEGVALRIGASLTNPFAFRPLFFFFSSLPTLFSFRRRMPRDDWWQLLRDSLPLPPFSRHLPMFALLDREKLGSLHMPLPSGASSSSVGTSGNASLQLSSAIVC